MPIGLERRQQTGQFHFITFSCYRRLPYLEDPEPKNILEQVIEKARQSHALTIYAYVLMPEHVHLYLWSTFNHYATGRPCTIEIASEWVKKRRFARSANAHSCDTTA